jgi:hypothetical protein
VGAQAICSDDEDPELLILGRSLGPLFAQPHYDGDRSKRTNAKTIGHSAVQWILSNKVSNQW